MNGYAQLYQFLNEDKRSRYFCCIYNFPSFESFLSDTSLGPLLNSLPKPNLLAIVYPMLLPILCSFVWQIGSRSGGIIEFEIKSRLKRMTRLDSTIFFLWYFITLCFTSIYCRNHFFYSKGRRSFGQNVLKTNEHQKN